MLSSSGAPAEEGGEGGIGGGGVIGEAGMGGEGGGELLLPAAADITAEPARDSAQTLLFLGLRA